MKRYQKIPRKDGADEGEEDDCARKKEDAADKYVSPQDAKVLPERERLDVCLVTRHLGFFGGSGASLFIGFRFFGSALGKALL